MKRTFGFLGTLVFSAALLALPAAAEQRGTRGSYSPGAAQTYAYSGYSDSYIGQYSPYLQEYGGSNYGYRHDRDDHDRDRREYREQRDRREFRRDSDGR